MEKIRRNEETTRGRARKGKETARGNKSKTRRKKKSQKEDAEIGFGNWYTSGVDKHWFVGNENFRNHLKA